MENVSINKGNKMKKIIMPALISIGLVSTIAPAMASATGFIDTTYLPNQLWPRADVILRSFYPTQAKGNLENPEPWRACDLTLARVKDSPLLTHQHLLALIREKRLEIPLDAIAQDTLLKAHVWPFAERFGESRRELESVAGVTDLRDPRVVDRIKEIMERVVRSLIGLRDIGSSIPCPWVAKTLE